MKRNVHSNILYCDPNDRFNFVSDTQNIQLAPDLEDYCIMVDLEVEIPGRTKNPKSTKADNVMVLRWANKAEGNNVSFLQGTRLNFPNSKGYSYLTTAAYDFATHEDVWKTQDPSNTEQQINSTNELFGINSIDIEYNNYMVPVITIDFTDIRGISLFAPEEIRHRKTYSDGKNTIHGYSDSDIAGSFFKCFFTFPYPRFKMMVKGFYGEPTAYELTCTDFRARFDSNTGNFGATAKFIGYSYSLLGDITLSALIAAPLDVLYGADYWSEQTQSKFRINGKPMPTLADIVAKSDEVIEAMQRLSKTDPNYDYIEKSDKELQALNAIQGRLNDFIDKILEDNQWKASNLHETSTINGQLVKFTYKLKEGDVISSITSYDANVFEQICDDINEIGTLGVVKHEEIITYDSSIKAYIWDITYVYKPLVERIQKLTKGIEDANKNIASQENDLAVKALGFKPTIENVTDILLAHLETFLYSIYQTVQDIDLSRTPLNTNIGNHGLDIKSTDFLPAFPKCVKTVRDNYHHIGREENAWVGDLGGKKPITEKDLIEGLLKGIERVESIVDETTTNIELIKNSNVSIKYPISIIDLLGFSNPFGDVDLSGDISDHYGHLAMRMTSILGINGVKDPQLVGMIGKADAHNFYLRYPSLHEHLMTTIMNDGITKDAYESLTNGRQENEVWGTSSLSFISKTDGLVQRCVVNNSSGSTMCVRLDSFYWDNIINDIDNGGYINNIESYLTNVSVGNDDTPTNAIKIIEGQGEINNLKSTLSILDENSEISSLKTQIFGGFEKTYDFSSTVLNKTNGKFDKKDVFEKPQDYYCILPKDTTVQGCEYKKNQRVSIGGAIKVQGKFSTSGNFLYDLGVKWSNQEKSDRKDDSNSMIYNFQYDGKSLFGQADYYKLSVEEQAVLFLNQWDWEYDLVNLKTGTSNTLGQIFHLPKYAVLWLGGYYYVTSQGHDTTFNDKKFKEILKKVYVQNVQYTADGLRSTTTHTFLETVDEWRDDIKRVLIKYFKEWVKNDFTTINNHFSLGGVFACNELKKIFSEDHKDIIKSLKETTSLSSDKIEQLCKAYLTVNVDENDELVLINRESEVIDNLLQDAMTPCLLLSPLKNLKEDTSIRFKVDSGAAKNYLKNFNDELKRLYEKEASRQASKEVVANTDKHIKIALYNYIKILWDKWLSGTPDWQRTWSFETFKKHWYFVDSYYNKIGQDHCVNLDILIKKIEDSLKTDGYSLLSFLFGIYQSEKFGFYCVQNFMGEIKEEKMMKMFDPIPYHKINYEELDGTPDFILMYTGEYSNKLDIEGADQPNDSYMIATENYEELPTAIKDKKLGESGFRIPAFGVSFGKQYQNYFKTFDVSMDSPMVTEQALRAQFNLASSISRGGGGEMTKTKVPISPDLYTIYANNSYTCTIQMMGCAWVQPLMYFQLNNVPMFRGTYLIQKVTHRIVPGDMTTTFIGTRMSKETTPIMKDPFIQRDPNQGAVDGTAPQVQQGRAADITNNCPYKFFTPYYYGGAISENLLESNAITASGGRLGSDYANYSLLEVLAASAYGAVGGTDKLAVQLTATIHYNRYMNSGEQGFASKQFFVHNQVEFDTSHAMDFLRGNVSNRDKVIEWVKEIYLGSPAILEGQYTRVTTPYTLSGVNANQKTESKSLTLDDLQMMNGYATPHKLGYEAWMNGSGGVDPQQINYICHHTWNNDTLQHIFVNFNGKRSNWKVSDTSSSGGTASSEDKGDDLYDAIIKTVEFSKELDIKSSELRHRVSNGVLKINMSDKNILSDTKLGQIYDIIVSTYSDYIDEAYWIIDQSPNDFPNEIQAKISDKVSSTNAKTYAIATLNGGSASAVTHITSITDEEGTLWDINPDFCMVVKKKFGNITEENVNTFIHDVPTFSFLREYELNEKVQKVNEILNVEIKDCDKIMEENASNPTGPFSWQYYGGNNPKDSATPQTQQGLKFNTTDALKYLHNNRGDGKHCATYVSRALEAGGVNIAVRPESACCYSKFLKEWGFTEVKEIEVGSPDEANYTPQNGDIAVYQSSAKHPYGHIQMYSSTPKDGKHWLADVPYKNLNIYQGEVGRIIKIFQWKG